MLLVTNPLRLMRLCVKIPAKRVFTKLSGIRYSGVQTTIDGATFMRLLDRLPDAARYETDAYGVYGALLVNKHMVGKYGAVNWNDGFALCCAAS